MLVMMASFRQCTYWELVAKCLILLTIALSDRNRIVVVLVVETIIRDILDASETTSSVQKALELGLDAGPNLDSGAIAGIRHGNVVNVQILHNIGLALVLAEGADANAMGAIADEVLDDDIGTVGLERNTVWDLLVLVQNDEQQSYHPCCRCKSSG